MADFVRIITDTAKANGWTIERTNGGHLRLSHPNAPKPVFAASTPSDHRAVKNVLAMMRRFDGSKDDGKSGQNRRILSEPFDQRLEAKDGWDRLVYVAVCKACGAKAEVKSRRHAAVPEIWQTASKIRSKGWRTSVKRCDDRCPKCIGKPANAKIMAVLASSNACDGAVVASPTVTHAPLHAPVVPTLPRQSNLPSAFLPTHLQYVAGTGISKAQQRKILAVLEKVYIEGAGYVAGESDDTVATRLGVGRHWVEGLRQSFFEAKTLDRDGAITAEIEAIKRDVAVMIKRAADDGARLTAKLSRLAAIVGAGGAKSNGGGGGIDRDKH